MPNIKSAKKRVRVTEKKTLINMAHKTALKTAIKKFEAAARQVTRKRLNSFSTKLQRSLTKV